MSCHKCHRTVATTVIGVVRAYAYECFCFWWLHVACYESSVRLSVDELLDVAEPADVVLLLLVLGVRDDEVGEADVDAALGEVGLEGVLDGGVESVEF